MVLAGGAARRMGGAKASVPLHGRPLLAWAVGALRGAGLDDVVVVAKRDTVLPSVGAEVWREPDEPRHPLTGVRWALARAGRREILTLPVDLPLVPPDALRALLEVSLGRDTCAAAARTDGRVQPLVARFAPAALARLPVAGRATDAVLALDPVLVDVDPAGFVNVNAPEDLARAARRSGWCG